MILALKVIRAVGAGAPVMDRLCGQGRKNILSLLVSEGSPHTLTSKCGRRDRRVEPREARVGQDQDNH